MVFQSNTTTPTCRRCDSDDGIERRNVVFADDRRDHRVNLCETCADRIPDMPVGVAVVE
jgi:hypothetical protein